MLVSLWVLAERVPAKEQESVEWNFLGCLGVGDKNLYVLLSVGVSRSSNWFGLDNMTLSDRTHEKCIPQMMLRLAVDHTVARL